jgi:hypothetical protein
MMPSQVEIIASNAALVSAFSSVTPWSRAIPVLDYFARTRSLAERRSATRAEGKKS